MPDQPGWGCWLRHGSVGQLLCSWGPMAPPQEAGLSCGPFLFPQTIPGVLWLGCQGSIAPGAHMAYPAFLSKAGPHWAWSWGSRHSVSGQRRCPWPLLNPFHLERPLQSVITLTSVMCIGELNKVSWLLT